MPNSTAEINAIADNMATRATHLAVQTTTAATTAGTEATGGSPAYARKPLSWGASSGGVKTATPVVHDLASGTNAQSVATYDALVSGNFRSSAAITPQTFSSQGTLTTTPTITAT